MTSQQFIVFGPLMLAVCTIMVTALYIIIAGWATTERRRRLFGRLWVLWPCLFGGAIPPFVRSYGAALGIDLHKGVCSTEQFAQMLVLVLLGLFVPAYGVLGFIARCCPALWQRFTSLLPPRDAVLPNSSEREPAPFSVRPCPHCGIHRVGKVRGLHRLAEGVTFAILFLFGFLPGIIYYIYMESVPYCTGCGRRVRFAPVQPHRA